MIFFRTQVVRVKRRKGAENFLLFARLTAYYDAPIDALSGMTVNLADVDRWMQRAQRDVPLVESVPEALKIYDSRLRQSSPAFQKVSLSVRDFSIELDGSKFLRTYEVKTWFFEDSTWVQRPCSLQSDSILSIKWRKRLARKKWSTPEIFADLIGNCLPQIKVLEVHHPEIRASEKYRF